MTRADIIRMAREAGLYEDGKFFVLEHGELTRFAAIVAAAFEKLRSAASMPAIKLAMEAERENGARAEREACAELVEGMDVQHPKYIAAAIRARSNA